MKIQRLMRLLLLTSVMSTVMLSSCSEDDEDNGTPEAEGTFTDVRDNQTYKWVQIGEQKWMAENLNYTDTIIQYITDDNEWENNSDYDGWCYYENNSKNRDTYAILYQWESAKKAYPDGWHLPTNDEWSEMEDYLSTHGYSYDGIAENKYIAKSLATISDWSESTAKGVIGNRDYTDYINKTGFSALPSGYRNHGGAFGRLSYDGYWWSATEDATYPGNASFRTMNYTNSKVAS